MSQSGSVSQTRRPIARPLVRQRHGGDTHLPRWTGLRAAHSKVRRVRERNDLDGEDRL
jgi:hypothetical protein